MKLKKIEIGKNGQDGYRNLIDFKLNFTNQDGLTILIGNNGSGKSHLIEAISLIFYKIYIDDIDNIGFKFLIEYEKDTIQYRVHNIRGSKKFFKNNMEVDNFYPNLDETVPDKIFTLYSGEELRLWEECYFEPYKDYYQKVVRNESDLNSLRMNYINKYFWDIAILLLYIKNTTQISSILDGSTIDKIMFEVNSNTLSRYNNDSPNNVTRAITEIKNKLNVHNQISLNDFKNITYNDESENSIGIIDVLGDLYYILLVALLPNDESSKTLKKVSISFTNGWNIKSFSEGQKKEILVTFITEILASQNSLFLLDEPDSHIHPIKKMNLINILKASDTQSIIMTTHSPTLIKDVDVKHLILMKDGKAEDTTDKIEALREITDGKWAIDSINNVLIANKDILLVEGKTDVQYIETALTKLREYVSDRKKYSHLDFIILPFNGASGLTSFIDKFSTSENQKVIALLDKDEAGKQSFCSIFTNKRTSTLTNDDFSNIHEKNGIKIVFLPPNNNEEVFEIEDYFTIKKLKVFGKKLYDNTNFTQLKSFFDIKEQIKKKLPTECINFPKTDFKNFRKLFDLIVDIKNSQ